MLIATSLFVLSPHIQPAKAAETKIYGYLATFVARYEPDTINIGRKTYKVTAIGNKAFCGLKQLTSFTIGSNTGKVKVNSTILNSVVKDFAKKTSNKLKVYVKKKVLKKYNKYFSKCYVK